MAWNTIKKMLPSAGLSLVGFGLDSAASAIQFKQNKELASLKNQYNIDQWNRENAYNHPANQMKRFQQAGLNPNLIYGGAESVSAPSPTLESGMPYEKADIGALNPTIGLQAQLLQSQIDNINADTEQKRANTDFTREQLNNYGVLLDKTRAERDKLLSDIGVNERQKEYIIANTQKTLAETQKIYEETEEVRQRVSNLVKEGTKTELEIQEKCIELAYKEEWYQASIKEIEARTRCSNAQAQQAMAATFVNNVLGQKYQADTELTQQNTERVKQENARYNELTDAELLLKKTQVEKMAAEKLATYVGSACQVVDTVVGIFKPFGKK